MTKHKTVSALSKRFLACTSTRDAVKCLEALPSDVLDEQLQQIILNETLFHEVSKKFPAALSYRRSFLKALITLLESSGLEVIDDIYSIYGELVATVEDGNAQFGYVTYVMDDLSHITLKESKALVLGGTTGLTTWVAAKYLSEWCLANKELLRGKRILELGCGVGFTGLTVCKRCSPASYTFSDCHDVVLDTVRANVNVNGLRGDVQVHIEGLDWEDASRCDSWESITVADVILGSDLMYDVRNVLPLVATLKRLLGRDGVAYVVSTIRNPATYNAFLEQLDKSALQRRHLPPPQREVFIYDRSVEVALLEIRS